MSETIRGGIWVFCEQRNGKLHEVGPELLGKGRELAEQAGTRLTAVLLGHKLGDLPQALLDCGADRVLLTDDPQLAFFRLLAYTHVLAELARREEPAILLLGATAMGMELAPRVAARLRTGLSAHCIDLRLDADGRLLQVVPGWGGGVLATIACPDRRPQMATVMPGAMRALPRTRREGEVFETSVALPAGKLGPAVLDVQQDEPRGQLLEKAEVVVAGGFGVGSKENWTLVQELAALLGGAVGATRPPVDEGWAGEGQMIGQSGKTVRPSLYIGLGISGVMHHVVGMEQSGHIISINTNPKAEIFDVSDVAVVGDLRKIVPKLIAEIKARKTKA